MTPLEKLQIRVTVLESETVTLKNDIVTLKNAVEVLEQKNIELIEELEEVHANWEASEIRIIQLEEKVAAQAERITKLEQFADKAYNAIEIGFSALNGYCTQQARNRALIISSWDRLKTLFPELLSGGVDRV